MRRRAPVRPRFVSPSTGDSLTLEESVADAVRHFGGGVIEISGPPGSGKSQALSHLQAVLPSELEIDYGAAGETGSPTAGKRCLVLEVPQNAVQHPHRILRFDLAPWGVDEIIEYCLARYGDQCPGLPQRIIGACDLHLASGNAELTSLVIDCFAEDSVVTSVVSAFQQVIDKETDGDLSRLPTSVRLICDAANTGLDAEQRPLAERLHILLRHRSLRTTACAMIFARIIERGQLGQMNDLALLQVDDQAPGVCELLPAMITVCGRDVMRQALQLKSHVQIHPIVATALHYCDPDWRPHIRHGTRLRGAKLRGARWSDIDLRRQDLTRIDLADAELQRALLIGANLEEACLRAASLQGANLRRARGFKASLQHSDLRQSRISQAFFREADFTKVQAAGAMFDLTVLVYADFTESSLRDASFRKARMPGVVLNRTDLSGANLSGADLRSVDFRTAVLDGAVLASAQLEDTVFEDVEIENAVLCDAVLRNAVMTSSVLPAANLRGACLRGAYLADVRWPGAILQDTDLTGATFHMGSSRSGIVHSDLASEGTRTGFYTDDYDDHLFRSPEEIRTADLRGCDLREAIIDGVDFWRVDMRGAKVTLSQRKQLIATGAILD